MQQLEFQVGEKTQNVLSLQIIQVAIKGIVAIKIRRNRHRFRVKDKEGIKDPKTPFTPMLHKQHGKE
jgi:hypothetical protein